jgi:hypothetical protein
MRRSALLWVIALACGSRHGEPRPTSSGPPPMSTYCNPLDLDYTYMIYNSNEDLSYRSGADPAVVSFRGEYYMFVTRSMGYWHSTDLSRWTFIEPQTWYPQGCNAPAAANDKDERLYVAGDPSGSMSILYTDNPKKGDWKGVPSILNDLQDPDLFIDDDGKAYMYWGSSNVFPIRGRALEREHRFRPSPQIHELFNLDASKHGWERFGENHTATTPGYIEGAWMTKHDGTYYLQYAAPGTEFNVYADGVYTSKSPLGPFTYAPNNPICYKPGGFANGAGHGSTVLGPYDQFWHFASASISVNVNWERRLNMFPTYFDKDGLMHADTSFGDYPHFAPSVAGKQGQFAGWMLLSYGKPVRVSSTLDKFGAENLVDENIRTFWVAARNDDHQWIEIDLQKPAHVYAIQVNYHDYRSNLYGRVPGLKHRYVIEGSIDGHDWKLLVDKHDNDKDVPNDYVELAAPQIVRYVRFENVFAPTPHLAISDLRVFGKGDGNPPTTVEHFEVKREQDRRDATITWAAQSEAQGYNILWGIAPDKLYSSWLVYGASSLNLKSLTADQRYYFSIEAFNENGISSRANAIEVN